MSQESTPITPVVAPALAKLVGHDGLPVLAAPPAVVERCKSLQCKGMYLNWGLGQNEQVAGDGNFWCGRTQRIFGPDDRLVGDGECRDAGRACYVARG
jgi:hypothetical protein